MRKPKQDAKFTEIKTGNTELDKLLDKAISLGKSQQTSASAQVQALARVKQAQVQLQKAMQAVRPLQLALRHQLEIRMVVCLAMGLIFKEVLVEYLTTNQL